jgi:hypothetical protein
MPAFESTMYLAKYLLRGVARAIWTSLSAVPTGIAAASAKA